MLNLVKRLVREEEGQGMVEYALIIGLIAIIAMATLSPLGTKVAKAFTDITTGLKVAVPD